jgi:hypothetical protein
LVFRNRRRSRRGRGRLDFAALRRRGSGRCRGCGFALSYHIGCLHL